MNLLTLSRRSLLYHVRSHIGAILGSAVAAAVLIGALVVGDSVRESLKQMALARLGKTAVALASSDRLFTIDLAAKIGRQTRSVPAAVLQLPGVAVNSDSSARANQVQVLGVAEDFWKLAPTAQNFVIPPDGALLSDSLARQIRAQVGDSVILRVQKPSQLSQDPPLARAEDHTVALRLNVERILTDEEFGRFGLLASQVPPFNAFVNRDILEQRTGVTNKANLIVLPQRDVSFLNKKINEVWTPAAAELNFRQTSDGTVELRTPRIFLDSAVADAATKAVPASERILTYFVNQLKLGDRTT